MEQPITKHLVEIVEVTLTGGRFCKKMQNGRWIAHNGKGYLGHENGTLRKFLTVDEALDAITEPEEKTE